MGPGLFSPDDGSWLHYERSCDFASMGPGLFSPDDRSHSKSFVMNEFGTLFREVRPESLSVWVHEVLLFLSIEFD